MSIRNQRINAIFAREINHILTFEIKNPDINLVSVSEVKVSNDLSIAKVFVSLLNKETIGSTMQALNNSKGFIKTNLAKKLNIRKIPELNFIYDDTLDKAKRIEDIINKHKNKE